MKWTSKSYISYSIIPNKGQCSESDFQTYSICFKTFILTGILTYFFFLIFDSGLVPPKCRCLTECFLLIVFLLCLLWYYSPFSICPVFSLQFLDSRQTCRVFIQTWEEQLWPQQSRVHGEGAAEQRGLPEWHLSGSG